ncbi:MAG: hypothetical protein IJ007_08325 [Oscillospiraceae bacterium]|nr:hypothetical protein [Oscillospiraceae bacterium]
MSKSIKQYKQAMDNIRISDSFSQRTEVLLKEMSSAEKITVSSEKSGIRYLTFGAGLAAAACIALVFTLNPNILGNDIETETAVSESTVIVSEVTPASETIYIDIETDDNIYTAVPADIPDEADYKETEAPASEENEEQFNTSAALVTVSQPESAETAYSAVKTDSEPIEEAVEAALPKENLPQTEKLYDIDFTNAETSLTSYLNSGLTAEQHIYSGEDDAVVYEEAAPSGLNFLILDEKAAKEAVTMIADAVSSAPVVEGKEIVHTEFVIDITDLTTDETAFTINMCFDKTIQIIAYGQDTESSAFYAVADHDFIEIEKYLFLKFGSMTQYEKFIGTQN